MCGTLCKYLEERNGQTLSLHHRDFLAGHYIADNIFEAFSQSRKIIFVISRHFLGSSWCEYELDMARMQMFQENRDLLILILLEDIPVNKMPKSLLTIWKKVTCLRAFEIQMLDYKGPKRANILETTV